jgi:hypothetical protein
MINLRRRGRCFDSKLTADESLAKCEKKFSMFSTLINVNDEFMVYIVLSRKEPTSVSLTLKSISPKRSQVSLEA